MNGTPGGGGGGGGGGIGGVNGGSASGSADGASGSGGEAQANVFKGKKELDLTKVGKNPLHFSPSQSH